jgi:putative transposase
MVVTVVQAGSSLPDWFTAAGTFAAAVAAVGVAVWSDWRVRQERAKVYVLAAIEHSTRRIRILGATGHPVQAWVVQQTRNLLMDLEDAGTRVRFVIHDRDASFTLGFDVVFMATGARVIRSAVQAPRMNSIMERWIGSCRRELLDRTLIWNHRHLMTVLREYGDFHNTHRPHRSLKQAAPMRLLPETVTDIDHF